MGHHRLLSSVTLWLAYATGTCRIPTKSMQGRSGLFSDCHTRATRTKVSAFGRMSDIAFRRGRWSQRVWLEGRGKGVKSERGGRLRLRSSSEGEDMGEKIEWKEAEASDIAWIASRLLKEKMNPIISEPKNFLVAFSNGERVACGQVRRIGGTERGMAHELCSLYVEDSMRGKGIGTRTLRRLIDKHWFEGHTNPDLFLLTLKRTAGFYERLGFETVDVTSVPKPMQAEYALGKVVASLVANDQLVCMLLGGSNPTMQVKDGEGTSEG
ncbi:hypothetical protein AAMO2058_000422000 [Amorphochlora amoebiformis]